jgi:dTDP-4-dehydrorhamnose 3,5-epimerase
MYKKKKIFKKYDKRGFFLKFFNSSKKNNINEYFITESKKNVFRGFHYYEQRNKSNRSIYLLKGKIIDYLIDLRKKHFGKLYKKTINEGSNYIYFLPSYCAHAYLTVKKSQIIYFFEKKYKKKYDKGIHYKSVKAKFNKEKFIISPRDKRHPKIQSLKISLK